MDRPTRMLSPLLIAPLVPQRLQLRDGFEILRAAGGSLYVDQARETQAAVFHSGHLDDLAVRQQFSVSAPARDLPKEVQVPKRCREGEVEAAPQRLGVPPK